MSNFRKDLFKKRKNAVFGLTIGVISVAILSIVFLGGVFIGRKEPVFWFFGRMHNIPGGIAGRYGHGAIGTIDSLGKNTIVLKERSGELETVLIDDKTILRKDNSSAKYSDFKKGEKIIVIGEPQEQEEAIKARFIRIVGSL